VAAPAQQGGAQEKSLLHVTWDGCGSYRPIE
jgi:hypothetical protein